MRTADVMAPAAQLRLEVGADETVSLYAAWQRTGVPVSTLDRWTREGKLATQGVRQRGRRTVTLVSLADTHQIARERERRSEKRLVLRERAVAMYEGGHSTTAIGAQLSLHFSTVNDYLRAAGVGLRPPGRRRIHPLPTPRPCLRCGQVFTPRNAWHVAHGDGLYCDHACFAAELKDLARRGQLAAAFPLIEAHPKAWQRWQGLWKLDQVREAGRHAKGKREAAEMLTLALEAVRRKPDLTRKVLLRVLIQTTEGRGALFFDDGRRRPSGDRDYEAARKRILRRFERGFRDAGRPAELARFFD